MKIRKLVRGGDIMGWIMYIQIVAITSFYQWSQQFNNKKKKEED